VGRPAALPLAINPLKSMEKIPYSLDEQEVVMTRVKDATPYIGRERENNAFFCR